MAAAPGLDFFYSQIGVVHGLSGFVGKIALGSALALVHAGVRKPGQQIFGAVIAIQFLAAAWTLFDVSTGPTAPKGSGFAAIGIAATSLVLAILFGVCVAKPEGEWSTKSIAGWKNGVGALALLWAFYYPEFTRGAFRPILMSPTGALPQPTLVAALVVAWLSMPNPPRLAAWGLVGGGIVVGAIDATHGVPSSLVLVALAGLLGFDLVKSVAGSGGVLEDDVPPVETERKLRLKREVVEKTEPQKRFKLK